MKKTVRAGRVHVGMLVWLLAPIGLLALHFGPGVQWLARDRAGDCLRAAEEAAAREDWAEAVELYGEALKRRPPDDVDSRQRIELAQASARIAAGEMIEGQEQLERLLAAMQENPPADPKLLDAVAGELASANYYAAWIMRLEGANADEWKAEAELSRQRFRLLAERAQAASGRGNDADSFQRNLEAVVRLEQMGLSDLKARPLPKKCCQCKNLSQRKRKQAQSRSKSGKKQDDIRREIQKGAGLNEREKGGS